MFVQQYCEERDACAIIAFVNKAGRSTHENIIQTINALRKMGHRSGDIHGEGDGCGISTDIPRDIWARRLADGGLSSHLALSNSFFVGHFLVPASLRPQANKVISKVKKLFTDKGIEILIDVTGATRDQELGPRARAEAPLFWQVAGLVNSSDRLAGAKLLFDFQVELETRIPELHIASLSLDLAVYKVQGVPDLLPRVYPELVDEDMRSVITLGHSRYSTNTLPTVERSQPFSTLGHNGEINTIERLRNTGRAMGIRPVPGGSDSQDLDRLIQGLIQKYGLDLPEAMETVFPAIHSEVDKYPVALQELYHYYRWFFPGSAQGPAAVVSRHSNICMGSVDALGLRPLWFAESDYNFFLSSEKGVVSLENTMSDPRPLAPGEKIAIIGGHGNSAEVMDYSTLQQHLLKRFTSRPRARKHLVSLHQETPAAKATKSKKQSATATLFPKQSFTINLFVACGWRQYDLDIRKRVSLQGREVIGSMGHTGPLAAFVPETLPNISDYFKENVAVVTNPAIDREREAEHFSLQVTLGSRPDFQGNRANPPLGLVLDTPLLLSAQDLSSTMKASEVREVAKGFSTSMFEDVLAFFSCQDRDPSWVQVIDATFEPDKGLNTALKTLADTAKKLVKKGAALLILDDSKSFTNNKVFIDPALAVAYLNEALIQAGLRRETGIIVRSAAIRNLHDIMLLLGLGADALNPYLLWNESCRNVKENKTPADSLTNTLNVLTKGMEKVMSTMGIHELCGYGRIFSSIGLTTELADILKMPNFCSSKKIGLSFHTLEEMGRKRYASALAEKEATVYREPPRNPKVGRILRDAALGKKDHLEMARELEKINAEQPAAIRHLFDIKPAPKTKKLKADQVDISIGHHDMPLVIAAMSFGSQGENSFRSYANAARQANIVSMNGEGGEIPDMLGHYRKNRGQQVASGRFGVFMEFLNSADFLEIKIGQGAKPGEGGHLPGTKVTKMVASARHCKTGITLISPSNHHDIYSIEDLAQIITELKTANPTAKISIKIPVTSGVGTIAVGIAKAGADIVNLSGFEGGTGAAREHAKRYVGLPAEIGVSQAHNALLESGLRDGIEIWADGGARSGSDILKLILLGANRVGLGTVALMGVGCISCQKCHLDTCPRGISTQLQNKEEALARGVKGFFPRDMASESDNLARLLSALGDELRTELANLGQKRLQDLVGRTEFLEQIRHKDLIDTASITHKVKLHGDTGRFTKPLTVRKPLSYMTKMVADLSLQRFEEGEKIVRFAEEGVKSTDRAVGTYLAGAMVRNYGNNKDKRLASLLLDSSVPGNGLCAFNTDSLETVVIGGSQDGAAKGASGGSLTVLKGSNLNGLQIDGSTGKSFAYGAIGGLFMIQNMADSRACVRMSGADVIFGGRITTPINDALGNIASRAHLKGFAFEYMTGGRAVVLGDPGPWICAGMTGGVIYQCLYPELNFEKKALERRLARGANVSIQKINAEGRREVEKLLGSYIEVLRNNYQEAEAQAVETLLEQAGKRFVMIVPKALRPPSAE